MGEATLKFMLERAHAMYSSTEQDDKVPKPEQENIFMDGATNVSLKSEPQRTNGYQSTEGARKVTSKYERIQTVNDIIKHTNDKMECVGLTSNEIRPRDDSRGEK